MYDEGIAGQIEQAIRKDYYRSLHRFFDSLDSSLK
jgi:hypothetical protein